MKNIKMKKPKINNLEKNKQYAITSENLDKKIENLIGKKVIIYSRGEFNNPSPGGVTIMGILEKNRANNKFKVFANASVGIWFDIFSIEYIFSSSNPNTAIIKIKIKSE